MKTSLNALKAHKPCIPGYKKLQNKLGNIGLDDEISLEKILEINGILDCLWAVRASDMPKMDAVLLCIDFAEVYYKRRADVGYEDCHLQHIQKAKEDALNDNIPPILLETAKKDIYVWSVSRCTSKRYFRPILEKYFKHELSWQKENK